tara:strand:+ start:1399 stop:1800 length:402 start_codon:yes stop_codon:yes gene_type:complete
MAHYAFLNDENLVIEVIVGRNEDGLVSGVTSWEDYYADFRGQRCFQTSYNTCGGVHYTDGEPSADQSKALRFNYAGIGYTYDKKLDAFIPPKPYPSWKLDKKSCLWVAPISMPKDGAAYTWDEASKTWTEIVE